VYACSMSTHITSASVNAASRARWCLLGDAHESHVRAVRAELSRIGARASMIPSPTLCITRTALADAGVSRALQHCLYAVYGSQITATTDTGEYVTAWFSLGPPTIGA
jgi:hypothetical protein